MEKSETFVLRQVQQHNEIFIKLLLDHNAQAAI